MIDLRIFEINPFMILEATPRDTRAELIDRQSESALFDDSGKTDEALALLLHPENRLRSEIHWFPETEPGALRTLWDYAIHGGKGKMPDLRSPSVLARFQAARLVLCLKDSWTPEDLLTAVHCLAILADALYPGQVMEEINRDREKAGFAPLTDQQQVETELRLLLLETASVLCDGIKKEDASWLTRDLEKEYKNMSGPFHNSYLIELTAGVLSKMDGSSWR